MKRTISITLFLVMVLGGISAFADGSSAVIKKTDDPKAVTKGEVRFKLNSEYCKVSVDGEDWDQQEFYDNGYAVVLYGIDRTQGHTIKLTPAYPKLMPVEIKITPKMWKIVRYKPGVKVWRLTKRIRFKKANSQKKKGKK